MTEKTIWSEKTKEDYGFQFMVISNLLDERAARSVEEEPIKFLDIRYLAYVEEQDGAVTLKDLEKALGLASPTVAGAVKGLERKGLVTMTADTRDRRIKLVTLTDAGRAILDRQDEFRARSEDLITRQFTDEELETLRDMLGRVRGALETGVNED